MFLTALIVAFLVTAVLAIPSAIATRDWRTARTIAWLVFPCAWLLTLAQLYFVLPAITGAWGGYGWALCILFCAAACGAIWNSIRAYNATDSKTTYTSTRIFIALAVLLIVFGTIGNLTIAFTQVWNDGAAHNRATLANIRIAPASEGMPPTDVQHIVMVPKGVAQYIGSQSIASNGQNLGSLYQPGDYTLQSINHHLYWIAPLVYQNVLSSLSHSDVPGYIAVDAENVNASAKLHLGFDMKYVPGTWGGFGTMDLVRHVYLSGYINGSLDDPTLEVNDSWQPYFTISLEQPTQVFDGAVVKQVLVVDPQSGDIHAYAPGHQPTWIDRIIPSDLAQSYATNWGLYHDSRAGFYNFSNQYTQKPASDTPELVYNNADTPVWVIPMTSNNSSDNSSTGVILYDTQSAHGTFYPFAGHGIGGSVSDAFTKTPANIRNYSVSSVQLYQIDGRPTWVAIYTQSVTGGDTYTAIGLLDATHVNAANVIMASTKDQALANYANWLASNNVAGQGPTSPGSQSTTIHGKVFRISCTAQSCTLLVVGDPHIYTVDMNLSPYLAVVQPGDSVIFAYLNTKQQIEALTSFEDLTIEANFSN